MTRSRRLLSRLAQTAAAAVAGHYAIEWLAACNIRREQKERSWLGDRLYTEIIGAGDPVVVMAGLQGSTRYWNHAFDSLGARHRVIYTDALGFGRSPWPDRVGLDEHLAAMENTLNWAGAGSGVTIVAHSLGTVLAAYFAATRPGRVRQLILMGTPIYHDTADARLRIREMSQMAALFSLNPLLARESCNLVCAARPLFKILARHVRPDLAPEIAEDAMLHHWPSMRGAMAILQHEPIARALEKFRGQTTFIHGLSDTITPLDRAATLASQIGGRLLTIEGNHHSYLNALNLISASITER